MANFSPAVNPSWHRRPGFDKLKFHGYVQKKPFELGAFFFP